MQQSTSAESEKFIGAIRFIYYPQFYVQYKHNFHCFYGLNPSVNAIDIGRWSMEQAGLGHKVRLYATKVFFIVLLEWNS